MLHERIAAAVRESGIKQKVIAVRMGVSEQALSAMLAGRRKIGVDEFYALCTILGVAPDALYGYGTA